MYKLLILTLLFPFFAFSNVNLNAICTSNDNEQLAISDIISNTICDSWHTYSSDIRQCYNAMNRSYNYLGSKGWTRKELNFLGYHIIFSNNRRFNRRIQNFIFYIDEGSIRSTKPINRSELLDYVNQFRSRKLTRLEEPTYSGCENLFNISPTNSVQAEESTTEAGTECIDCQGQVDQLNSAIDQLGEQIASLQSRLNQLKIAENQRPEITCTKNDGSSFKFTEDGLFDCPQVEPYNCIDCRFGYAEDFHDNTSPIVYYTCSDDPDFKIKLIADGEYPIPELGITCKKTETTSAQNQNLENSPSNR